MLINKYQILAFFCLIFLHNQALQAAEVLAYKKKDKGTDLCCFDVNPNTGVNLSLVITINSSSTSSECPFPWTIRAIIPGNRADQYGNLGTNTEGDIIIGQSREIIIDNFTSVESSNLISTSVDINLFEGMATAFVGHEYAPGCEEYFATRFVEFKIMSGEDEIDLDCSRFVDPGLTPNSSKLLDEINLCTDTTKVTWYGTSHDYIMDSSNNPESAASQVTNDILMTPDVNFLSKETLELAVNLYPNPVDQILHIEFSETYFDESTVELFSLENRKIMGNFALANRNKITLDTRSLTSGFYFLRIKVGEKLITKKIIVAH